MGAQGAKGGDNPSVPIMSIWRQLKGSPTVTEAVPLPGAVLCVNMLLTQERWQKGDGEGCVVSHPGVSWKKRLKCCLPPIPWKAPSDRCQAESLLCMSPKGESIGCWDIITYLLFLNWWQIKQLFISTWCKKREQKPCWLILVPCVVTHNYDSQLQKLLMQTIFFFSALKPECTMLCTQPGNIASC